MRGRESIIGHILKLNACEVVYNGNKSTFPLVKIKFMSQAILCHIRDYFSEPGIEPRPRLGPFGLQLQTQNR